MLSYFVGIACVEARNFAVCRKFAESDEDVGIAAIVDQAMVEIRLVGARVVVDSRCSCAGLAPCVHVAKLAEQYRSNVFQCESMLSVSFIEQSLRDMERNQRNALLLSAVLLAHPQTRETQADGNVMLSPTITAPLFEAWDAQSATTYANIDHRAVAALRPPNPFLSRVQVRQHTSLIHTLHSHKIQSICSSHTYFDLLVRTTMCAASVAPFVDKWREFFPTSSDDIDDADHNELRSKVYRALTFGRMCVSTDRSAVCSFQNSNRRCSRLVARRHCSERCLKAWSETCFARHSLSIAVGRWRA
jgi:hypothetical protein